MYSYGHKQEEKISTCGNQNLLNLRLIFPLTQTNILASCLWPSNGRYQEKRETLVNYSVLTGNQNQNVRKLCVVKLCKIEIFREEKRDSFD